jgi:hypothetical protein
LGNSYPGCSSIGLYFPLVNVLLRVELNCENRVVSRLERGHIDIASSAFSCGGNLPKIGHVSVGGERRQFYSNLMVEI